jgi:hypothetical protein
MAQSAFRRVAMLMGGVAGTQLVTYFACVRGRNLDVQLRLWKREKFMTEGIREEEEHLQS